MSDVSSGAGPGGAIRDVDLPPEPAETAYARTTDPTTRTGAYAESTGAYAESTGASDASAGDKARQVAYEGRQAAAQATGEVTGTAREQAQRVTTEAKAQVRNLASDVRDRVGEQARTQTDRLATTIRQTADQLDEMRGDRADSPAATVVSRVADGGRQFADYLDRHGPEGVLREVQDFARRRPGAFLATALAAGFVVGRLGKSVAKSGQEHGKPDSDSFTSRPTQGSYTAPGQAVYTPGETVSTEYAATGTGTPIPVTEEYVSDIAPPTVDYPGGQR